MSAVVKRGKPLERRTPLKAKKGLDRTGQLDRRTRIKPVSEKQAKLNRQRAAFRAAVLARRPWCEACPLIVSVAPVVKRGRHQAVDVHEPLTRARLGSIIDETNTVTTCRWGHDWIHDHTDKATELGLLVPSWKRTNGAEQ